MAEKYLVKHGDKELGKYWVASDSEAKEFAHLDYKDIPVGEMKAEIIPFTPELHPGLAQDIKDTVKVRKPRSDKGLPHAKKIEGKKFGARRKPEFFVYAANALSGPYDRDGLADILDGFELEVRNEARVFPGPELHFERRIQLTLKPAK
jgi:hypothetical protein